MASEQEGIRKTRITIVGLLVAMASLALGILGYLRYIKLDEEAQATLEANRRLILSGQIDRSKVLSLSIQQPPGAGLQQVKILWPEALSITDDIVDRPYEVNLRPVEEAIKGQLRRRFSVVETRSGPGILPVVIGADSIVNGERRFRYGLYAIRYSYQLRIRESPILEFDGLSFADQIQEGQDPREVVEARWNQVQAGRGI